MRLRALALLMALLLPMGAGTVPTATMAESPKAVMTQDELLAAVGLDMIFRDYVDAVGTSPERQGMPMSPHALAAWKAAAAETLQDERLNAAFRTQLGSLAADEMQVLSDFYRSDFGLRMSTLEVAVQQMGEAEQLSARDEGLALLDDGDEGALRAQRIDEVLEVASAELGRSMVVEATRALLIGMVMAGAGGDIDVPWDEIDAQLAAVTPSIEQEILKSQRGLSAWAYRDLTDAELATYLDFLRKPAARKFYASASFAAGLVMHDAMREFGETFATLLKRGSA